MDDSVETTLKKGQCLLLVEGPVQAIEYLGKSPHAAAEPVRAKLHGIVWNHYASLSSELLGEEFLDPIHSMCDACGSAWMISPLANVLAGKVDEAALQTTGQACPSCGRALCPDCARTNGGYCDCGQSMSRMVKPNGRKRKQVDPSSFLRDWLPKGPDQPTASTKELHLYFGIKGRVPIGVDPKFPQEATAPSTDHLSWAEALIEAGVYYQAEQQLDLLGEPVKSSVRALWLRARLTLVRYHNARERDRREPSQSGWWDWPKIVHRELEDALQREPTFGPAWLTAAEATLECEPVRALPLAERARDLLGETPPVLFALGRALRVVGRPADAAVCLQRLVNLGANNPEGHRELKLVQWEARCQAKPIDLEAHAELGRWCWLHQQFKRSTHLFTTLVEQCPDRPEGYYGLAELEFMGQGTEREAPARYRKVRDLCHEALRRNSRFGRALELLGHVFRNVTTFGAQVDFPAEDPFTYFRRALEYDETCDSAWWILGSHFIDQGDLNQAVACLEKAAALETTTDEVYRLLSVIYMGRHQYDQAVRADQKAQEIAPHLILRSECREKILKLCEYEP